MTEPYNDSIEAHDGQQQTIDDLLAALIRCRPQIEYIHLYQQRDMTAAEAVEISETLKQTRAAIDAAKG